MRIILYLEEDEPSTITRIAEPSVKTCQHDALVAHQVVECAFAEDEAQDWENLQVPRGDDDLIIEKNVVRQPRPIVGRRKHRVRGALLALGRKPDSEISG